jgi:hypothetical protein
LTVLGRGEIDQLQELLPNAATAAAKTMSPRGGRVP